MKVGIVTFTDGRKRVAEATVLQIYPKHPLARRAREGAERLGTKGTPDNPVKDAPTRSRSG